MYLTKHPDPAGARWALDGRFLPAGFSLGELLRMTRADAITYLRNLPPGGAAGHALLPPVEADHEVWAAGVTYLRSREAREAESAARDVYARVYEADRPELFFKAAGWRVAGHDGPIRVRGDSGWNVPEPELTLVVNARGEVAGFTAGNDVSSRDIEGENPLYLPQAKVYDGSCAIGPGILLAAPEDLLDIGIEVVIVRAGRTVFEGGTRTSRMKRSFEELVSYLGRALDFPRGVFLMTGTGIVPPDAFTLAPGDAVRVRVGPLTLENHVAP